MKEKSRIAFIASFFFLSLLACGESSSPIKINDAASPFVSFRDVPGVTAEEIADIEKLQKTHETFIFGGNLTTESFLLENGKIGGYSALFCEWLSSLFSIRFQPAIYEWNEMLDKFNTGAIDFTGSLTATAERAGIYYMTDPIAERQFKIMRLKGSPGLDRITHERLPRYAFLQGSNIANVVAGATVPGISQEKHRRFYRRKRYRGFL